MSLDLRQLYSDYRPTEFDLALLTVGIMAMSQTTLLSQICVVLVETSHPGNIGAAARAMKTMGLTKLILVQPKTFPSMEAVALASNAEDVLDNAIVVETLDEAIADCHWVFGTSARDRHLSWPMVTPREMAQKVGDQVHEGMEIALVFGSERTGLSNEQLKRCHAHVHIPTNPDYSSLNLAQAVQILCYECRLACADIVASEVQEDTLATQKEVQGFYEHLQQALFHLQILDPNHPKKMMRRLERLFQRAHLSVDEVNILRGICKAILTRLRS